MLTGKPDRVKSKVIPWEGWLLMIGIYKITNKLNGHIYIGLSKNIEERWKKHCQKYKNSNDKEYEKYLYRAFRKYGIDNFTFEVIEECEEKELRNREIYWISYYDSYANGYNETPGGEIICDGGQQEWQKGKYTQKWMKKRFMGLVKR